MTTAEPLIRNISDTARWAAAYRARESDRPDAIFRDPLARRLAGERGEQTIDAQPGGTRHSWAWVTRTWLFDHFIAQQVREGADAVINLAAGLDTRPFRMELPASLKWVEVDLPELLEYKREVLKGEKARCQLELAAVDLSDVGARRALFEGVGRRVKKVLVVSEGILIYLSAEEVASLARDLASQPTFKRWVAEIASPGLLRMLQKQIGDLVGQGGASLKFGPEEGPEFFVPHGWKPVEVRSMLKTAARLRRLPLGLRFLSMLPSSNGRQGSRPWSGVCLLDRN